MKIDDDTKIGICGKVKVDKVNVKKLQKQNG